MMDTSELILTGVLLYLGVGMLVAATAEVVKVISDEARSAGKRFWVIFFVVAALWPVFFYAAVDSFFRRIK